MLVQGAGQILEKNSFEVLYKAHWQKLWGKERFLSGEIIQLTGISKNVEHLSGLLTPDQLNVKLLTWNCCRGAYETKTPLVDHFDADIAVFQEIAKPAAEGSDVLWFGKNPKIGMAVRAKAPYSITLLPQLQGIPDYIIPVQVLGPQNFTLVAVWTTNDKALPYVRSLSTAIDRYAHLLGQGMPVVVMGDFNSNAIWDKQHPKHLNHSSMVERLDKFGLVSAHHYHGSLRHGEESESTFYLHRKQEKGFHIEYCFLPKDWAEAISAVRVERFEELASSSDHRPLVVGVTLETGEIQ